MSNSIQELTVYQTFVLTLAADHNRKYIIMEGPSPDDDQDKKELGIKNLAEIEALVGMGWFLYAPEEDYAAEREDSRKRGCTCVGYLVPPRVRTMFQSTNKAIN